MPFSYQASGTFIFGFSPIFRGDRQTAGVLPFLYQPTRFVGALPARFRPGMITTFARLGTVLTGVAGILLHIVFMPVYVGGNAHIFRIDQFPADVFEYNGPRE